MKLAFRLLALFPCLWLSGACRTKEPPAPETSESGCVDRWLKGRQLDEFGNAPGTMYTGGTPLFDERTGQTRDRLAYVYDRQPDAREACARGGAGTRGTLPAQ